MTRTSVPRPPGAGTKSTSPEVLTSAPSTEAHAMRSAATSPVVTASHSTTVSNGALAAQWLELGPVTRTSSRCAMNVARFSSRCQKPYTSCGGLLTVVVEVSSMGVLLREGGASAFSQARRQGDLHRQDDRLRRTPARPAASNGRTPGDGLGIVLTTGGPPPHPSTSCVPVAGSAFGAGIGMSADTA